MVRCSGDARQHAYWDGLLGDWGEPTDAETLAATLPAPDATAAAIEDPVKWVSESEQLAEQFVYTGPIREGAGPFALADAYQADAHRVAQQQVALAGALKWHSKGNEAYALLRSSEESMTRR
jgi:hypothetical protein